MVIEFVHPLMRRLSSWLLVVVVMVVVSCSDDDERLEPVPYQVLESIVRTDQITFDEALQGALQELEVSEEEIEPYRKAVELGQLRSRVYKAHIVTYHTTDPSGQPTVASGVVYYPKSGKPKGVIETLSFNKEKFTCPSK